MYTLSVPGTEVAEPLLPGRLLFVTGPATDPKSRFAASLAATGHADGGRALLVTTDDGPGATLRRFREQAGRAGAFAPDRLAIVASEEATDDDITPQEYPSAVEAGRVRTIPSATAFTAFGTAASKALGATASGDSYWLVLDSLSDVLARTDATTVFKFCHVLGDRLRETGGLGVVVLDDGHQRETVQLLRRVTDGELHTRPADKFDDGDCQFRLELPDAETGWRVTETATTAAERREWGVPRNERYDSEDTPDIR
jgi:hypothetical protein